MRSTDAPCMSGTARPTPYRRAPSAVQHDTDSLAVVWPASDQMRGGNELPWAGLPGRGSTTVTVRQPGSTARRRADRYSSVVLSVLRGIAGGVLWRLGQGQAVVLLAGHDVDVEVEALCVAAAPIGVIRFATGCSAINSAARHITTSLVRPLVGNGHRSTRRKLFTYRPSSPSSARSPYSRSRGRQ